MSFQYHSFAGPSRGLTNPTDIYAVNVDEGGCEVPRCTQDDEHFVLMWSGNEYSKNHTWIMADKEYTISLEDAR